MFGSLVNALKGLQGMGGGAAGSGQEGFMQGETGQGILKGLQGFSEGFAGGGEQSGNPWGDAIGQIGAGIQTGLAAREKEKGMPPRPQDNSDVPLAPMGGAPPMAAPGQGIPGAPPGAGPPPPPDQIGMEPLRFKDQHAAQRPMMMF